MKAFPYSQAMPGLGDSIGYDIWECATIGPLTRAVSGRARRVLPHSAGPLKFGNPAPGRGGLSSRGRKHLTAKQKAFVGARMSSLKHGGDRGNQYTGGKSPNGELAESLSLPRISEITGASERQISRATQILKHEEIREKVEGGRSARAWGLRQDRSDNR